MSDWKKSFYWNDANARTSAFFQFGIAALVLKRPVVVIEVAPDPTLYLDPVRIYGMRAADENLCLESAKPGKAESPPAYFMKPIKDVLAMLTASPRSMSVTFYNGTDHFNPILYSPPAPPPIAIPESRPQRNKQPASRFGVDDGAFVGAASSFSSNLTSSNTGKRKIDYDEMPKDKSVGDKVLAYGWYAGERRKFHAEILEFRDKAPRVVVKYTSDEHGRTTDLCLPTPKIAYLPACDVE